MQQKIRNNFSNGFHDGIPIMLGYFSVSFAFGILVINSGLPIWVALMISMTNLTSAGQFAGLNNIIANASLLEIAFSQFIINIRYSLMSLSLSQRLDDSMTGLQRWLIGFGITDEIFGVASQKEGSLKASYLFGLIIGPYCGWTLGTLVGACASYLLPQSLRDALGIALYGMFIAIIIPQFKKNKHCALIIVSSILLNCIFSWIPTLSKILSGWTVIISAIVSAGIGALLFPISEENTKEKKNESRN